MADHLVGGTLAGPVLPSQQAWQDVATLASRARARREDAPLRLCGLGRVMVVMTSVRPANQRSPVAGMRVMELAELWRGDVTAEVAAWSDRLARSPESEPCPLPVPPVQSPGGPDVAMVPPVQGWVSCGFVAPGDATGLAWDDSIPMGAGQIPAGMLHTAADLGFLRARVGAAVMGCEEWWRISTTTGHVVARKTPAEWALLGC